MSKWRGVDELLARARLSLDRVKPDSLSAEIADGALVVDTRPKEQRDRDGDLPGALVIDRNVLEWRLDPACSQLAELRDYECRIIIVCNEGYSSSIAAASLKGMGLENVADLEGGFQAWRAFTAARDGLDEAHPESPS